MPRRTHPLLLVAALAVGLLLAVGVAACGGSGSQSAETLETPPLTVGTSATLPSTSTTSTTRTSTTTATTDADADTGGATDPDTSVDTGGAVDPDTGDTGVDPAQDTGGGAGTGGTDGGDTGTPTPEPTNPGGAAPDYDDFCNENPGAC